MCSLQDRDAECLGADGLHSANDVGMVAECSSKTDHSCLDVERW